VTGGAAWVADGSIGWRILLSATLPTPPDIAALTAALTRLYDDQHWPVRDVLVGPSSERLRHELVAADPHPLLVGVAADEVVVSAHHSAVDGLGLLEVLSRCELPGVRGEIRSSAHGIGDRPPAHGLAVGIASRLAEAALRPPARPAPSERVTPSAPGDALVDTSVAGRRRTAEIVHAAATAISAWQRAGGGSGGHLAVAVGASRIVRAPGAPLADDSALLRLRDVERMTRDEVAAAVRSAPPEPSPHGTGTATGTLLALGMRLLRTRLGSSLLVSHLGEVSAPGVEQLVFHPVTAGGSGLSLGAVGHAGRTTLTLRARAARWDRDGLERLLEAIVDRLPDGHRRAGNR